jgi:small subunit ribosomal protein S1
VKVQIIKFNKDTGRISLGMKQLMKTPWENIEQRYIFEQKYKCTVTNITDYGAFVELEEGVEGMVYITEMGWVRKNVPPSKLLTVGQQVEVMVLEVNKQKHRISLGLKQCQENPWQKFAEENPVGSVITGEVKNTTEFGIFIGVTQDLDGMIHMSDVSWHGRPRDFERGQQISVVVLDVKPDKERISLGLKQLEKDPYAAATAKVKKGDIVNTSVKDIHPSGVDVILENGLKGFIKKIDLSSDRLQQRTDMLSPGDKLEAVVLGIERNGVVNLSVKELEKQQEAEALKKFGSTDCGASFGDILGEAIRNNEEK